MNGTSSIDVRVKDAAFVLHQANVGAQFAILMAHTYGSHDNLVQALDRLEAACAIAREMIKSAEKGAKK